MSRVTLTRKQLDRRGSRIRRMLECITYLPGGPAWTPRSQSAEVIIAAHAGQHGFGSYRDWLFPTLAAGLYASYYERWIRRDIDGREAWCLAQAYLTIRRVDQARDENAEYMCLHCDPLEPDGSDESGMAQARYKRGPHLHVSAAGGSLQGAHLALNAGHLEQVLSSEESLSQAFECALTMISKEVLKRAAAR